jgi:tRNA 2-thiouridine synthesizing protein A
MSEKIVDARGLICPLPVLKARKALLSLSAGESLTLLATDLNTPKDAALFCQETGHIFVSSLEKQGFFEIVLRRV